MENIAQDVITKYKNDGLLSLISSVPPYTYQNILKLTPFICGKNKEIYELADSITSVNDGEETRIKYNGSQREILPDNFIKIEEKYHTPERIISRFSSSKVVGKEPIIKTGSKYIPPCGIGTSKYTSEKQIIRNLSIKNEFSHTVVSSEQTRQVSNGFLLTGNRGIHYPHWLWEVLPKIRGLEKYCEDKNIDIPTIIIPSGLTDWHYSTLRLLGYTADQLLELPENGLLVENLFVSSHRIRKRAVNEWQLSPTDFAWLRKKIVSNNPQKSNFAKRVYIERGDAERRLLVNEKEVINTLSKFGFESYDMTELSFEEEADIFNNAEIVVGPHSAGLSSLFLAENISFIELLTTRPPLPHYFILAHEMGYNYEFLPSEPSNSETNGPVYDNMVVNTDSLAEVLSLVGVT